MVPYLRKYQIRIPRKILGRNSCFTFVLALSRDFKGARGYKLCFCD